MKISSLLLTLSTLALTTVSTLGGNYSFSGDTTGTPTFNRPTEAGDMLSEVGTSVPYYSQFFSVTLSGNYSITLQPVDTGNYDSFLHIYSGSFSPGAPLDNFVAANDDAPGGSAFGSALSDLSLTAGNTYFLVASGFGNSDYGAFNAQISGPGNINVVPEPVSGALAGLGMAAVLIFRRKQARC